ncbi:hypothetical protein MMC19_003962 [Ptychographa xylographoides]|nr:hypothetical protein [Ptychographa xylographoides]
MAPTVINPNPSHVDEDLDETSVVSHGRALIGNVPNHWMHSAKPPIFDLTRPSPPDFAVPSSKSSIKLTTTTTPILISPALTALVIIDMQNFFISTDLGRPGDGAGNLAKRCLLTTAIPAARKAGIRIIWLNWGLTDQEIEDMPASTRRAFGFEVALNKAAEEHGSPAVDAHGVNQAGAEHIMQKNGGRVEKKELTENGKPTRLYKGLGSDIGPVTLEDGTTVDGGKLLMRDTWNAALPPDLDAAYKTGQKATVAPDVWIHKNRMSGLWGSTTPCCDFLETEGIKTLLFAGVNTDQCVGGSLQDAFSKGWDCILLKDACGTTSPTFASEMVEFNCARTWGFVSDCNDLAKGVDSMLRAS